MYIHVTRSTYTAYHYKPIQLELVPTVHCTGVDWPKLVHVFSYTTGKGHCHLVHTAHVSSF